MKQRKTMKISTSILIILTALLIVGVFASNFVFKQVYDKRDKGDLYWNYNKIIEQPYKYLKINGGNVTNIIFEQNERSSVRVLNSWHYADGKESKIKVFVKNDTLYLVFKNLYNNLGEKYYMQDRVLVRLFSPQLLSIDGSDTNFELQKLKQANISINLTGKSRLEVENYDRNFDTLRVAQSDSSRVIFEMSPDLKGSPIMHFKNVSVNMTGYALLDIGRGYADNLKLNLSDSSAVILSGKSLKILTK